MRIRSELTFGVGAQAIVQGMDCLSPLKAADPQRAATNTIAHRGIWVKSQLLAEIRIPGQVAEGSYGTRSSKGSERIWHDQDYRGVTAMPHRRGFRSYVVSIVQTQLE